jgi:hypothetical protein
MGLVPFWRRRCFANLGGTEVPHVGKVAQTPSSASRRLGATNSIAAWRLCVHFLLTFNLKYGILFIINRHPNRTLNFQGGFLCLISLEKVFLKSIT